APSHPAGTRRSGGACGEVHETHVLEVVDVVGGDEPVGRPRGREGGDQVLALRAVRAVARRVDVPDVVGAGRREHLLGERVDVGGLVAGRVVDPVHPLGRAEARERPLHEAQARGRRDTSGATWSGQYTTTSPGWLRALMSFADWNAWVRFSTTLRTPPAKPSATTTSSAATRRV